MIKICMNNYRDEKNIIYFCVLVHVSNGKYEVKDNYHHYARVCVYIYNYALEEIILEKKGNRLNQYTN